MRRTIAALLLLTACAGTSEATTTLPEPTTAAPTTPEATTTTTLATTTTIDVIAAACTEDALLQAMDRDLPRYPDLTLVGVEITECQAGYARVIAMPDQSICPEANNCMENEQVFLRDVSGRWEIIGSGTGLTCSDADLSEELVAACEALDLR
ncbi:MAG: hypothetical protein WD473_02320 [Acidimicrobiia bacterium]